MIFSNGRELVIGANFNARNFNIEMFNGGIDPLIMVDHFRMSAPTFPPHPHAGLSAVTYVFPESHGAHMNFDSLNEPISIEPGDIHWFASGSGAIHTEQPKREGSEVHALQIFVNLPVSMKHQSAYATHVAANLIPTYSDLAGTVRIVAGHYAQKFSPLRTPTPFMFLDCYGNIGKQFFFPVVSGWNYFLYIVRGEVQISTLPGVKESRGGGFLKGGQSLGFSGYPDVDGSSSPFIRSCIDSHYVLLGGKSLDESYSLGGPIVMENIEANLEKFQAYKNGEFGQIRGYDFSS
jgi:redox-sensitive bicupin YhaK (pirin superfamily)